jgi:hypothetical protein
MAWIVLGVSIIVFNTTAYIMKKKLTVKQMYSTILFALFLAVTVDMYASFRFDAWGFFNPERAELARLLIVLGIYPAVTLLIINWYPYKELWWKKLNYLLLWSIFSVAYEWFMLELGVLWYGHWRLIYSLLLYPFLYYLLIVHVKLFQRTGDEV